MVGGREVVVLQLEYEVEGDGCAMVDGELDDGTANVVRVTNGLS